MEAILDMHESSTNEQVARLALTVWRLRYQMKTKDRQDIEVSKLKSRPLLASANAPIDGVRNMNGSAEVTCQMESSLC